jgi:D-sedoheptulose 7-phosphate isomerase
VFAREIAAIGCKGEVLAGLSTSGRSSNLVSAFMAPRYGLNTIAMTGAMGGDLPAFSDICLRIPSTDTQKTQEANIVLGQIICHSVERSLLPRTR